MSPTDRERLRQQLVVDEGLRLFPYTDTVGKLTIGIGRNLTDVGISRAEAFALLDNDITKAIRDLANRFPWVSDLDPVRVSVLVNLTFNMGIGGLATFVHTLAAVQRGEYERAAAGLRASRWYTQVQRSRSERLIHMLRTGEWPEGTMNATP